MLRRLIAAVSAVCMIAAASLPAYAIQNKNLISSTLSEGDSGIVIAIAAVAVVAVAALILVKKKSAPKSGEAANDDEE